MFDGATTKFLESGNALIVATVSPTGEPHATRAWGLTVLPGSGTTVRLLLPADDGVTLANLEITGAVAVTGADPRTYRSIQLKGHAIAVEPATDDDRARVARYVDEFFTAVIDTDGALREQVGRLEPYEYFACTIEVDDVFDQTPGPRAGGRVAGAAR